MWCSRFLEWGLALFVVFVAPGGHVLEDRKEIAAFGGERVFAPGWDFGEGFFGNNTVTFECFEALAEGAWVYAADRFF